MPHFELEITTRFVVEADSEQAAHDAAPSVMGSAISEGYADVSVSVTPRESRESVDYRLADLPVLPLTSVD